MFVGTGMPWDAAHRSVTLANGGGGGMNGAWVSPQHAFMSVQLPGVEVPSIFAQAHTSRSWHVVPRQQRCVATQLEPTKGEPPWAAQHTGFIVSQVPPGRQQGSGPSWHTSSNGVPPCSKQLFASRVSQVPAGVQQAEKTAQLEASKGVPPSASQQAASISTQTWPTLQACTSEHTRSAMDVPAQVTGLFWQVPSGKQQAGPPDRAASTGNSRMSANRMTMGPPWLVLSFPFIAAFLSVEYTIPNFTRMMYRAHPSGTAGGLSARAWRCKALAHGHQPLPLRYLDVREE